MRIESSVTAVSWIPSEAVEYGVLRLPFDVKVAHYDEAPPEVVVDPGLLIQEGRVRFANVLRAAIERELSRSIMQRGRRTRRRQLEPGELLVEQGEHGQDVYLLLDGILRVEIDGTAVAEVGPGAILGEHAALGAGRRTATLRAVTRCRVAVASGEDLDRGALAEVARDHRREVARSPADLEVTANRAGVVPD